MAQPNTDALQLQLTDYQNSVDLLHQARKNAQDRFNQLIGILHHNAWKFGLGILLWIRDKVEQVRHWLKMALEKVDNALQHSAPVLSLFVQSMQWLTEVKQPLSSVAQKVDKRARDLVDWEGSARKAYDTILPEQKAAVDDAVQKIEYVSGWLGKIAQENVNYVTDALHMLTEFVGKLVDAAVNAGGVITAPFAWKTLAEEAGNLTRRGLDQMLKAADRFAAVANEVRDLTAQSTDRSKLGAGWPQAVRT